MTCVWILHCRLHCLDLLNTSSLVRETIQRFFSLRWKIHTDYYSEFPLSERMTGGEVEREIERDEFSVEPEQDVWDVISYLALWLMRTMFL